MKLTKAFSNLRGTQWASAPIRNLVNFAQWLPKHCVAEPRKSFLRRGWKGQQGCQPPPRLVQIQNTLASLSQLLHSRQARLCKHSQVACQSKANLSYGWIEKHKGRQLRHLSSSQCSGKTLKVKQMCTTFGSNLMEERNRVLKEKHNCVTCKRLIFCSEDELMNSASTPTCR